MNSRISLVTPWTVAHRAPLSMEFSRQEYWNGYPFPSQGDLPNPGMELLSTCLLHWQVDSLPLSHLESPALVQILIIDEKTRKYESVSHPVMSKSLHLSDCRQPVSSIHGFSGQEHWSGWPFPSPGDFPDPGIEPVSLALQAGSLLCEPPGQPFIADSPHPQISELTD